MNRQPSDFARFLKRRRSQLGLSQRAIDAHVELGGGWTSRLEKGDIIGPPGRKTCQKLAAILEMPPDDLWARAAPERLRLYDPDLWAWHRDRLDSPDTTRLHDGIYELADEIAAFDREFPDDESIAWAFTTLLTTLGALLSQGGSAPAAAHKVVAACRRLIELPLHIELRLLVLIADQIEFAVTTFIAGARQGRGQ